MEKTPEELKALVKERYSTFAEKTLEEMSGSCCGTEGGCGEVNMSLDYGQQQGYVKEADLALGCGIPVEYAGLFPGATVVDLGSGAGNDVFVARTLVGEKGQVVGVDMTEKMIERAEANLAKTGFENVRFVLGEIESIPLPDSFADVVISNCVLNLVPDKARAFAEIFRILKPGGHFSISDVVSNKQLEPEYRNIANLYAGCVSGAVPEAEYMSLIASTGFVQVSTPVRREVRLTYEFLSQHISDEAFRRYRSSGIRILSVTVTGVKPA